VQTRAKYQNLLRSLAPLRTEVRAPSLARRPRQTLTGRGVARRFHVGRGRRGIQTTKFSSVIPPGWNRGVLGLYFSAKAPSSPDPVSESLPRASRQILFSVRPREHALHPRRLLFRAD